MQICGFCFKFKLTIAQTLGDKCWDNLQILSSLPLFLVVGGVVSMSSTSIGSSSVELPAPAAAAAAAAATSRGDLRVGGVEWEADLFPLVIPLPLPLPLPILTHFKAML